MAEVNAEKSPAGIVMHTDMLASEADAVIDRGSPLYYSLSKAISKQARPFLNPGSRVVDLFSRGGIWIEGLQSEAAFRCRFLSINSTEDEKEQCKNILRMGVHLGDVIEHKMDLAEEFPDVPSDLTLSVTGLSSMESERREHLMSEMFRHTQKKGALILVDKGDDSDGTRIDWVSMMLSAGFKETKRFWQAGNLSAWIAMK